MHPALVHEHHPVADLAGELHFMRDPQQRHASAGQALEHLRHLAEPSITMMIRLTSASPTFLSAGGSATRSEPQRGCAFHRPYPHPALRLQVGADHALGREVGRNGDLDSG